MLEKWLNKLTCGDCLEVMREMPDSSVDMCVFSPPYNLRNTTGGGMQPSREWYSLKYGYAEHDDNMPHEEYVEWQRNVLTECMRLIPDTGAIFYIHKWRVQAGVIQDRLDIVGGFPVRQIIIWQRSGGFNFNDAFFVPTYEVIYMIAKKDFKLLPSARTVGDVWQINQDRDNDHPVPFPVEIPSRIIRHTSAQIVFDPFMGSGTTAVAAKKLGRDFIGIELSPEYCEMAERRVSQTAINRS